MGCHVGAAARQPLARLLRLVAVEAHGDAVLDDALVGGAAGQRLLPRALLHLREHEGAQRAEPRAERVRHRRPARVGEREQRLGFDVEARDEEPALAQRRRRAREEAGAEQRERLVRRAPRLRQEHLGGRQPAERFLLRLRDGSSMAQELRIELGAPRRRRHLRLTGVAQPTFERLRGGAARLGRRQRREHRRDRRGVHASGGAVPVEDGDEGCAERGELLKGGDGTVGEVLPRRRRTRGVGRVGERRREQLGIQARAARQRARRGARRLRAIVAALVPAEGAAEGEQPLELPLCRERLEEAAAGDARLEQREEEGGGFVLLGGGRRGEDTHHRFEDVLRRERRRRRLTQQREDAPAEGKRPREKEAVGGRHPRRRRRAHAPPPPRAAGAARRRHLAHGHCLAIEREREVLLIERAAHRLCTAGAVARGEELQAAAGAHPRQRAVVELDAQRRRAADAEVGRRCAPRLPLKRVLGLLRGDGVGGAADVCEGVGAESGGEGGELRRRRAQQGAQPVEEVVEGGGGGGGGGVRELKQA